MSFTSEKINNIYNTLYEYGIKTDDMTDSIVKQILKQTTDISPGIKKYIDDKAEYKRLLLLYSSQNYTNILDSIEQNRTTHFNYINDINDANIISYIYTEISSNSNIQKINSDDKFKTLFNSISPEMQEKFKNKYKAYNYLIKYTEYLQNLYNNVKSNIKTFLGKNPDYKAIQDEYNNTFTLYPNPVKFDVIVNFVNNQKQTQNQTNTNSNLSIDTLGKLLFILTTAYNCNDCTFNFKGEKMNVSDLNIVTFYNYELKYDIDIEGERFMRKPLFILKQKSVNDASIDDTQVINYEKIITNKFISNYKKYVELYKMYKQANAKEQPKFIYDIMCVLKVLMEILVDMNNKYVISGDYSFYKSVLLKYIYNDNTKLKLKTDTINEDFFGLYDLEDYDKRQYEIYYSDTDLEAKKEKEKYKANDVDTYLKMHFEEIKGKGKQLDVFEENQQYVPPILYAIHYFSDLNNKQNEPINIKSYIESLEKASTDIDTITTDKNSSSNIQPKSLNAANTQENTQKELITKHRQIDELMKSIQKDIKKLNITINDANVFSEIERLIQMLYTLNKAVIQNTNKTNVTKDEINTVYDKVIEQLNNIKDSLNTIKISLSSEQNNNNIVSNQNYINEQTKDINILLNKLKAYLSFYLTNIMNKAKELNLDNLKTEIEKLLEGTPEPFQNSINESLQDVTDESLYEIIKNKLQKYLSSLNDKSEANYDKFKNFEVPESKQSGGARKSPKQKARNHSRRRLRSILNKKKHSKKLN